MRADALDDGGRTEFFFAGVTSTHSCSRKEPASAVRAGTIILPSVVRRRWQLFPANCPVSTQPAGSPHALPGTLIGLFHSGPQLLRPAFATGREADAGERDCPSHRRMRSVERPLCLDRFRGRRLNEILTRQG